jgi:predicted negative regulator of RcsB-dependent stress response
MSTTSPNQPAAKPNHPGDSAGKTDVQPPFEEQLRDIWEKKENRTAVFAGCAIVVALIAGWYGYKALAQERETQIGAAYSAAVVPARLRAFAKENAGYPLAVAADITLADDAFKAGNYAEAIENYDKTIAAMPGSLYASRALLGKAVAQIWSGKSTEGAATLRQLAGDPAQFKALRSEAAFHLATLAFDAGNFDEVCKFTDLVMQVDPSSLWAQRSLMLRARVPMSAVAQGPVSQKPGGSAPAGSAKLPGS